MKTIPKVGDTVWYQPHPTACKEPVELVVEFHVRSWHPFGLGSINARPADRSGMMFLDVKEVFPTPAEAVRWRLEKTQWETNCAAVRSMEYRQALTETLKKLEVA